MLTGATRKGIRESIQRSLQGWFIPSFPTSRTSLYDL